MRLIRRLEPLHPVVLALLGVAPVLGFFAGTPPKPAPVVLEAAVRAGDVECQGQTPPRAASVAAISDAVERRGPATASHPAGTPAARAGAEIFELLERQFLLAGLPGMLLPRDGGVRFRGFGPDAAVAVSERAPRPPALAPRRAGDARPTLDPRPAVVHASRAPPARPA